MVEVGEEFWLEYPPLHDNDDTVRVFVKVLSVEEDGGSFDVHDLATEGDDWTVFQHEVEQGIAIIKPADCIRADSFEGIVGDLDFDMPDLHVPDYSKMTPLELVEVFQDVKNKLADAGAMFVQKTEEEKDWRVQYDAILMEQRRRNP